MAAAIEVETMVEAGTVTLADLLLMFLYLEVLAMVGLFRRSASSGFVFLFTSPSWR